MKDRNDTLEAHFTRDGELVYSTDVLQQEAGTKIIIRTHSANSSIYTITTKRKSSPLVTISGGILPEPKDMVFRGSQSPEKTQLYPRWIYQNLRIAADFVDSELLRAENGLRIYDFESSIVRDFEIVQPDGQRIWYVRKFPIRIENELYPSRRNVHQELTDNLN